MSSSKAQRQHRVARILESSAVANQSQLVDLLVAEGIVATQATVSRDLEELGAVKVRVSGGDSVYAIPELPKEQLAPADQMKRVIGGWVVEVARSGDLVILSTPPACADIVASVIDRGSSPSVLGTIAGDDTVLVIAIEGAGASVADSFQKLIAR